MPIFTVGYGNREILDFLDMIRDQGTNLLVDVRSTPYSRFQPTYNQSSLENSLRLMKIQYAWRGNQLGGRPERPTLYTPDGYVDYEACQEDFLFQQGFQEVKAWDLQGLTIALMCSELRPEQCHRSRLVAQGLTRMGLLVGHLDENGEMITHQQLVDRITGGQESLLGLSPESPLCRSDKPIGKSLLD